MALCLRWAGGVAEEPGVICANKGARTVLENEVIPAVGAITGTNRPEGSDESLPVLGHSPFQVPGAVSHVLVKLFTCEG